MARQEQWGSKLGLVLAMAGNAVGLGNFLRFPVQAAQNGGGAFLIPYLVSLLVMGVPVMWIEWTMGRYGGITGHHSTPGIFQAMGQSRLWKYAGALGLLTCLGIASYYLYIESWCLSYAAYSILGGFGIEDPAAFFARMTGEKPNQITAISVPGLIVFGVCIGINLLILSRGLAGGIELVAKVGMPLLILFAIVLAVRGLMSDPLVEEKVIASPMEGLNFVWNPSFSRMGSPATWIAAAGQIFFTLSIGMGSVHCYASYLRRNDDVALTGATTAWTNEFCEVVLGSAVLLPIAVSYLGLAAVQQLVASGSGFGLGFMVLPSLFNNWGAFAPVAGFLWFGLLFLAAITSSLAMGQPIMAFLQDEFKLTRPRAAVALAGLLLILAIPVATIHQNGVFTDFDFWVGTFCLVVFALLEVVLFAWVFGMDRGWAELMRGAQMKVPRFFYYVIKYVTPTFLIVILLAYIFQPAAGWDAYPRALFSGQPMPAWEWSGDGMIGKLLHKDLVVPADAAPEVVRFNQQLRTVRTIDRFALLGVLAFFWLLVHIAWRRRRRAGLLATPATETRG